MDLARRLDKCAGPVFTFIILLLFFWKKLFRKLNKTKIRSVLVIKLSGFGDYALLGSTLVDLKNEIKPKQMYLLTFSKSNFEIINPDLIDRIIYLRKSHIVKDFFNSILIIKRKKIDLTIDFTFTAYTSAILTFFLGGKYSIGYKTMGLRKYLYDYSLPIEPTEHTSESYFNVVKFLLNEPFRKQSFSPIVIPYDNKFAEIFFKKHSISDNDLLIGIHPFSFSSGTYRKHGITDRYSALTETLLNKYPAKIIFSGTEEEGVYIKKILDNINSTAVIFCFNLSLTELFSIMAYYDLFISVDSGPMHVASLMGIPTIGIFGPDTPVRYGPLGANCRYIYHKVACSPCIVSYEAKWNQCTECKCINLISIDEIMNEINVMLGE